MIIYNITINIHESVHDQWMIWMQHKHIPEMLATGKFTNAKLVRVLVEEEMGGVTYSAQFTTDSLATLEKFYQEDDAVLQAEGQKLFGEKMLTFRTELQVISEH
ncbi:DUF4286 family protein [Flavobacterium commune]|jgi:predicted GNAT family N-acyltransferase|uniref:DUF4286 domain-containing protein n=1 Tax=Flavobacterium commune TaxID=1306519 RepID=A0A1D9P8X6_9FLAO|nr:DUF4286 family protein [Flavobacterium commune]AOZ99007.1 hypothetical protein BIW12_05900 [Flavobacterium commune]